MGTRGLLGFILKNGTRKGSYNHFDSYPDGLGNDILQFLLNLTPEQLKALSENVEKVIWFDTRSKPSEEVQKRYYEAGFANLEVNVRSTADWYCLLNGTQGAKALPHLLSGTLGHMPDDTAFLKNGLFCEWAYFIDLNKEAGVEINVYARGDNLVKTVTLDDARKNKGVMEQLDA
ncbi:hypothetical protein BT69DRAFT_1321182 [Atractiella rhizophila]|nr:hypothetical protein BT69DRAFT_1321182 [Atractiella rhizophila]